MLIVISPAKSLDFETPATVKTATQPALLDQSQQLVDELKQFAPQDFSNLMGISDKLALLNYDRYQQWQTPFTPENAKQALLAFTGDVYTGLDAPSFSDSDFDFAQQHLRILSGLYGILRPLDLMQPYRLEMGIKLANDEGKDLYAFWGGQITDSLNSQLKKLKSEVLVNLASNEYFRSVKKGQLQADIITPVFKDLKGDRYRIISFFAKKARGQMARYIIENGLTDVEDIRGFAVDGYRFNADESTARDWVFTRDEAPAPAGGAA